MEGKLNNLSLKFKAKGFMPFEIPGLINDVFTILYKGEYCNISKVNQELEDLGWGIEILDNDTYKIIVTNSWVQ